MKAKDISKAINWITGAAAVYFVGSAIAGAIKRRKGIGKVERIKRRIYKEVSLAQNAGVDFSKKYDQLTAEEKAALENVGHEVGWKQSKRSVESGKPYVESYYGSLRRAWNAVSGVAGIGRAYNVKDANGNICLTWIEDAQAHVDAEREIEEKRQRALEAEKRAAESRKRMKATRRKIDRDGMLPSEPVIPAVKEKSVSKKDQAYMDRANFASMFMRGYLDGDGYAGAEIKNYITDFWSKDYVLDDKTVKIWELIQWAWVNKKFDLKKNKMISMLDGKEYDLTSYGPDHDSFELLDKYYKIHLSDKGWRDHIDELDDMRRALLDKAKHMELIFMDDDKNWVVVKGDDRYNYLDKINWVMMIRQSYHNRAADTTELTVYPIRAFNTKEEANNFGWKPSSSRVTDDVLTATRSVKVIPIWEVDVKSITGISGIDYAEDTEHELWEIWREQLEYGDTDLDFEDWKRRVGDEYLKKDVLPYM